MVFCFNNCSCHIWEKNFHLWFKFFLSFWGRKKQMEKKVLRLKPSCEMFSRFPFFYQGNLEILKSGMETFFQIQWKKRFLKQDGYFSFDYWLRSILSILVLNPFQLLKWKNMSPCHYNQGSNENKAVCFKKFQSNVFAVFEKLFPHQI